MNQIKKRIVILFGSPHRKGFTSQMVNQFLNEIDIDRFELSILSCYHLDIKPCIDCGACRQTTCPYNKKDQMDVVLQELSQADFVILAAPIYFANFPAPLKALIDRTQQFFKNRNGNRSELFQKRPQGFFFFTSGASDPEATHAACLSGKMFFNSINAQLMGKIVEENTDQKESICCNFKEILPYFE